MRTSKSWNKRVAKTSCNKVTRSQNVVHLFNSVQIHVSSKGFDWGTCTLHLEYFFPHLCLVLIIPEKIINTVIQFHLHEPTCSQIIPRHQSESLRSYMRSIRMLIKSLQCLLSSHSNPIFTALSISTHCLDLQCFHTSSALLRESPNLSNLSRPLLVLTNTVFQPEIAEIIKWQLNSTHLLRIPRALRTQPAQQALYLTHRVKNLVSRKLWLALTKTWVVWRTLGKTAWALRCGKRLGPAPTGPAQKTPLAKLLL